MLKILANKQIIVTCSVYWGVCSETLGVLDMMRETEKAARCVFVTCPSCYAGIPNRYVSIPTTKSNLS